MRGESTLKEANVLMKLHSEFEPYLDALDLRFNDLTNMQRVKVSSLPKNMPKSGIYVFSENDLNLYVGRSKRLRQRLNYHSSVTALLFGQPTAL